MREFLPRPVSTTSVPLICGYATTAGWLGLYVQFPEGVKRATARGVVQLGPLIADAFELRITAAATVAFGAKYPVRVRVDNPASGEPQAYVGHRTCPDTVEGCNGEPPRLEVYGILAPGWTQEQVLYLIEHPLYAQSTDVDGQLVTTPHS